jgi:hypothetical protein
MRDDFSPADILEYLTLRLFTSDGSKNDKYLLVAYLWEIGESEAAELAVALHKIDYTQEKVRALALGPIRQNQVDQFLQVSRVAARIGATATVPQILQEYEGEIEERTVYRWFESRFFHDFVAAYTD